MKAALWLMILSGCSLADSTECDGAIDAVKTEAGVVTVVGPRVGADYVMVLMLGDDRFEVACVGSDDHTTVCTLANAMPSEPPPGTYALSWNGQCQKDQRSTFEPGYAGPTTFTVH